MRSREYTFAFSWDDRQTEIWIEVKLCSKKNQLCEYSSFAHQVKSNTNDAIELTYTLSNKDLCRHSHTLAVFFLNQYLTWKNKELTPKNQHRRLSSLHLSEERERINWLSI
jgi:hypothetical protein